MLRAMMLFGKVQPSEFAPNFAGGIIVGFGRFLGSGECAKRLSLGKCSPCTIRATPRNTTITRAIIGAEISVGHVLRSSGAAQVVSAIVESIAVDVINLK